jgi:hypothetical protein
MSADAPEEGDFALIVAEVDPAMLAEASESFAVAFRLDPTIAHQVLKSAPIVFARGLSRHEVKSVSPKLLELSKMGIEFRVTVRPTGKLPKLNWPVRPQFTAGDSGRPRVNPAFDWEDSAFVCPSCNEAFVFRRVGQLPLGETPSEETPPPDAQAAPGDPNDTYNVVLPKVADPAKVDKAAELIARYQGIPLDEAKALTNNTMISVARNVSRTDAQLILEEFKKFRIFGRMSKGLS